MNPLPSEYTQVYFVGERPPNGWPRQFAIVTAYNPDGRSAEPVFNRAADQELMIALLDCGLPHFRVIGGSRDNRHQEPGWGISLETPRIAQELSVRFRQLAFFWVEQGRISLVDARTGEATEQDLLWSGRWLGASHEVAL
jgi:hypothetical protein